jgi:aspartyl-tRNA(Asn)/glutamyl-tRNA(Gln) amidotransferase subunit C
MAKLTREEILKLAKLARISLTDEEIESFGRDISSILEYVEQLKDVDLGELTPTYQVTGLTNVFREDKVIDYDETPEDLLKNSPDSENNQIKVRRML